MLILFAFALLLGLGFISWRVRSLVIEARTQTELLAVIAERSGALPPQV